jgi:hypothetical protein
LRYIILVKKRGSTKHLRPEVRRQNRARTSTMAAAAPAPASSLNTFGGGGLFGGTLRDLGFLVFGSEGR